MHPGNVFICRDMSSQCRRHGFLKSDNRIVFHFPHSLPDHFIQLIIRSAQQGYIYDFPHETPHKHRSGLMFSPPSKCADCIGHWLYRGLQKPFKIFVIKSLIAESHNLNIHLRLIHNRQHVLQNTIRPAMIKARNDE